MNKITRSENKKKLRKAKIKKNKYKQHESVPKKKQFDNSHLQYQLNFFNFSLKYQNRDLL